MALKRDYLLGSALLLWTVTGLLALYLLCNPAAAALQERIGPIRLWGGILGLISLGLALPGRTPWFWLLPLTALPLIVLPPSIARRIWPASLAGGVGLTLLGLRRRAAQPTLHPRGLGQTAWRRRPRRPAYPGSHAATQSPSNRHPREKRFRATRERR